MTGPREPLAIDLGSGFSVVRERWRRVAAGAVFGILCAGAIVLWWPPSFSSSGLLLVREFPGSNQLQMNSKISQLTQLVPNLMGGNDGNVTLATELALLQSRAAIGEVVDSLRLEVQPRSPRRVPPGELVDSLRLPNRFKPVKLTLKAGPNVIPQGVIYATQAGDGAYIKLVDREDAITDVIKRLNVDKAGGEVVNIDYRGRDSLTASWVPNLLAQVYMARRKTVDRGLDQRRFEFISARSDTVRQQLRTGIDALARLQRENSTGVDPTVTAKAIADQYAVVEAQVVQLRASQQALDSLVAGITAGHTDPRTLAAFPDLLRSVAINQLVVDIATVETERTEQLARVAATAPEVIALAKARDSLVAQLLPMANAYRQSLTRQVNSLGMAADSLAAQLTRLPTQAAAVAKQKADVTELGELYAGMGAQELQARLAAMAEGGDVHLVDAAPIPRRVSFPRPGITLLVGLAGGLILGLLLVPIGAPAAEP